MGTPNVHIFGTVPEKFDNCAMICAKHNVYEHACHNVYTHYIRQSNTNGSFQWRVWLAPTMGKAANEAD